MVNPQWRWGTGPRGRPSSYPVQDQAIKVLESASRLWMVKMRLPSASAGDNQERWLGVTGNAASLKAVEFRVDSSNTAKMANDMPVLFSPPDLPLMNGHTIQWQSTPPHMRNTINSQGLFVWFMILTNDVTTQPSPNTCWMRSLIHILD